MEEGNKTPEKIPARGIATACKALIWFVIIELAVTFFTSEIVAFYAISQFKSGSYIDLMNEIAEISASSDYNALTGILIYLVLIAWAGSRYLKEVYRPSVTVFGKMRERLAQVNPYMVILAIILAIVGLMYLVQFGFQALYRVAPQAMLAYQEEMSTLEQDSGSVLMVIYTVILAPIAEELTFRGLIMGSLEKDMRFWAANIIQSLLFGLAHGSLIQGAYTFCLGFVLGYIAYQTKNILFPMLGHLVFNLVGCYLVDYMYWGGTPVADFAIIFGSLAAVYISYLLLNHFTWVSRKNQPQGE